MGGLIATSIPAIASVLAAIVASWSARAARRHDAAAQRLRDLEQKVSERRYGTYKPMIDLLANVLDPEAVKEIVANGEKFRKDVAEFAAWISIYGSDEAVDGFHNFMQSTYHNAPPGVLLKLYAEFVLSARRDMGNPETELSVSRVLGMRIKDIYGSELLKSVDRPLAAVCRENDWVPPWQSTS
ncbi:hypothetical protein H7827_13270 [Streptomyces sp. JH002]|uniref:hypothetical protein n=1 Tax=Streptomyces sp. JH002 TaxID=2763259 RepID=UPI003D802F1D